MHIHWQLFLNNSFWATQTDKSKKAIVRLCDSPPRPGCLRWRDSYVTTVPCVLSDDDDMSKSWPPSLPSSEDSFQNFSQCLVVLSKFFPPLLFGRDREPRSSRCSLDNFSLDIYPLSRIVIFCDYHAHGPNSHKTYDKSQNPISTVTVTVESGINKIVTKSNKLQSLIVTDKHCVYLMWPHFVVQ